MDSNSTGAKRTAPTTAGELLERVQASGGELRVADPSSSLRAAWRRAIHALVNGDALPEGYCVRHRGRDRGDLVISVVPIADAPPAPPRPAPIAVQADLRRCHAIVRATRDAAKSDRDGWIDTRRMSGAVHMRVSKDSLKRALLVVQAIVDEASRRGYEVVTLDGYHCPGGLGLKVRGHACEVTVKEESRRQPHVLSDQEERDRIRGYYYGPRWDYVATGRLLLRDDHESFGPPLATDRQRWRVEDRLPQLFARIEEKADAAEERRLEAKRRQLEEQARWEKAVARARLRLIEEHQKGALLAQLDAFRLAREARDFVTMARATRGVDEEEARWLDWVAAYADKVDPLTRTLEPSPPPDPTPENLAPFLEGFSAYGPRARW